MKKNLLFLLTALLTNGIVAQTDSYIQVSPPSVHVNVNASTGTTTSFNVNLYKYINLGAGGTFFASSNFLNSSLSLTSITPPASYVISSLTDLSALKIITCSIPNTAVAGDIYTLIVQVSEPTCPNGVCIFPVSITVDQVLSVTWSAFEAVQKENSVALSWSTETEKDNSHFIVERSVDGKNFKAVGEVKSTGNSNSSNKYQFEDTKSGASVNYYRIRSVSLEGSSDFSKVVSVIKKGSFDVKAFPTAQGTRVQIGADQIGEEATVQISNLNGQVISSKQVTIDAVITETSLDIPNTGIFILNVKTDSKSVSTKVFKY